MLWLPIEAPQRKAANKAAKVSNCYSAGKVIIVHSQTEPDV